MLVVLPAAVGANFTVNEALWPAAKVAGRVGPETVRPLPVTVALEMATLAVAAVTVTVCEALLPTLTDPKLREVGLAFNCPTGFTPVPVRETASGEFEALLATDSVPVVLPAAVGANFTVNVALWPAARVAGRVGPETVRPLPVTVALEMLTLALAAVTVTVCEALLPTLTDPKLREVGLAES